MTLDELRASTAATVTVTDVAALLDVDERTVRRACEDDQLPSITVGRRILIIREKLLAMLGGGRPDLAKTVQAQLLRIRTEGQIRRAEQQAGAVSDAIKGIVEEGDGPTLDEVRGWSATVDVRRACSAIGISASWGYQLIAEDDFPCRVLTIRGRSRVLTASLIALLEGTEPERGGR